MQVRIQPVTTTTLNILGRSLKWSVAKCYKRSVDYFTLDTECFDFSTSCVRKDDIVPLKHKEGYDSFKVYNIKVYSWQESARK